MGWFWWSLLILTLLLNPSKSISSFTSDLFDTWCKQHGKTYSSDQEKQHRLEVFEHNHAFVIHHNTKANSSYTLSLNAFADLTYHEFKASRLGLSSSNDLKRFNYFRPSIHEEVDVSSSVDWRKSGAVTGIKDQGSCGM